MLGGKLRKRRKHNTKEAATKAHTHNQPLSSKQQQIIIGKKQCRTQMEWRHLKQPTNQPDKTRTSPAPPTHSNGTKIASWQLNVRLCLGMQSCFSQAKYTCSSQANKHTNNLVTHTESHASAVSLLESGEQRYIKTINKQPPLFPPSSKFSDTRRTKL